MDDLQNQLLTAIFSSVGSTQVNDLALPSDDPGLAIYRANLRATAVQALNITFPTVEALIGESLMKLACEKMLTENPPSHGDWALWGKEFAQVLSNITALIDYPYVPDCARLDYICHQLVRAASEAFEQESLALLQSEDPMNIKVKFVPSFTLMESDYPIAGIRAAHKFSGTERKQKLLEVVNGVIEEKYYLLCFRNGFDIVVQDISETHYQWLTLLQQHSIGQALDLINLEHFSFEQWLLESIQNNLIHKFYG